VTCTTSSLGGQLSKKLGSGVANTTSFLQGRLVSLDVFRGIAIALMTVVNNPGGEVSYRALQHADWNGWTPTDLVFPFFLFIVGVAIPCSFASSIIYINLTLSNGTIIALKTFIYRNYFASWLGR